MKSRYIILLLVVGCGLCLPQASIGGLLPESLQPTVSIDRAVKSNNALVEVQLQKVGTIGIQPPSVTIRPKSVKILQPAQARSNADILRSMYRERYEKPFWSQ